jgi:signal transduction histidine kinase
MIVMVSPEGNVLDINPSGLQMMGFVHSDITPETHHRFENFFCCKNEYRSLQEVLIANGFFSDAEIQLKHLNGSPISVLISGAFERQNCRETSMAHFLVKDISHRKAMEKQLMQADKLASIGQLASGIAHEINNPLNIILGYTQLLLRDEEKESQKHQDLKIIEKHARTCKIIVGDLLSFARSTKTKKGVTHIHTVIEELLSVVRNSFELDRIQIERVFDSRVPEMVLDGEKIKQVFMNLLMNAKQAIGKDGTIRLISQYKGSCSQVRVQVIDSGCGISPEHLPCIFDPFFTTKSTGEGTGLGLSVSYGIIKNHGGEIKVDSHVGLGTTFTVILPEVVPEAVSTEHNGVQVS